MKETFVRNQSSNKNVFSMTVNMQNGTSHLIYLSRKKSYSKQYKTLQFYFGSTEKSFARFGATYQEVSNMEANNLLAMYSINLDVSLE